MVAVPAPNDAHRQPDLALVIRASETVGRALRPGGVVIYESTVCPGATEESCVPVIERVSRLAFDRDLTVGCSPERVDPGHRTRRLGDIVEVTSGSTPETARLVDDLCRSVIPAGIDVAPSIQVAEAAKIVENTQRDVNIALINELSIMFSHPGLDTLDVIEAASTKRTFVRLKPGLAGGHCIGVDPYDRMRCSEAAGHVPDIIRRAREFRRAREIDEGMAGRAAGLLVRAMIGRDLPIKGARALILGLTFKENCADLRNSKAGDLARALAGFGVAVEAFDPRADPEEARRELDLAALPEPGPGAGYEAVVLAAPHEELRALGASRLRALLRRRGVLFDVKGAFARDESDLRL